MISIQRVRDVNVADVIGRSPVAKIPGADLVLLQCLSLSACSWVGRIDSSIVCVWGLIPPTILSERAYLWLLTTDLIEENKFIFVRYSQRVIEMMLNQYPVIVGHTDAGQKKTIRWLKWLNAEFAPAEGARLTFTIRKKS